MFNKNQREDLKNNFLRNKALYITSIAIIVVMVIVVSVVAVTNRANKNKAGENLISSKSSSSASQKSSNKSSSSSVGQNENTDPSKDVSKDVLTFALPLESGKLFKNHDSEMQVFSNTMEDYRVHLGIDLIANENSPVMAVADGVVAEIWDDVLMGKCVAVMHDNDFVSVYKNLANDLADGIEAGVNVKCGQTLGYVGQSAMIEVADEPHLHMEMTLEGLSVNPLDYMAESDIETLAKDTSFEDVVLTK